MIEASDDGPEAREARARADALGAAFLQSCAANGITEAETCNAMVYALYCIAMYSPVLNWAEVVRMLRTTCDAIELQKAEPAGGMH